MEKKRKQIWMPLFSLLLLLGIFTLTSLVAASDSYVYDEEGVLSSTEKSELSNALEQIEETYDFACVLYIPKSTGGEEIRQCAAGFMQDYDIGAGESGKDAMCIIHVPSERDYGVVFRGAGQAMFGGWIQDTMLDLMLPYLKEDDFAQAYRAVIEKTQWCLQNYADYGSVYGEGSGDTADTKLMSWLDCLSGGAFLGIPVGFVIALVLSLVKKSKMKSIRPAKGARNYIPEKGVNLMRQEDRFIRTEVHKRKIEDDDHDSGGGHSGSFSHGGESFSGSSRKY